MQTFEYSIITSKGLEYYEARSVCYGSDQVLVLARNINKRKRAEEEVRKLTQILEQSPDYISYATLEGEVQFVNVAMKKLLNIEKNYHQRYDNISDIHPSWAMNLLRTEAIPTVMKNGSWEGETAIIDSKGEEIPVSQLITLHMGDNGKQAFLSTTLRDLRSRKETERSLRLALQRSNDLQEAIGKHAMISVTNRNFVLTEVNQKFCEVCGYSSDELIGASHELLNSHYHSDEFLQQLLLSTRQGGLWNGEIRYATKNGLYFWTDTTVVPMFDEQGVIHEYFIIHTLITKMKETEQALKEKLQKEKELNEMKNRFVSLVSHEFRTPLTGILGAAKILGKQRDKMPIAMQNEYLNDITSSVERLTMMVNDILSIAQSEAGKMEWHPELLDLSSLCNRIVESIKLSHESSVIAYSIEGNFGNAKMDSKLLQHILINLLSNACKYSSNGSVVEFLVRRVSDNVVFTVRDNGVGMRPEDQERLFEPFYRSDNVATIQGTGLGMTIVKNAVDLQAGSIEVESVLNEGTTIQVQLPLFG